MEGEGNMKSRRSSNVPLSELEAAFQDLLEKREANANANAIKITEQQATLVVNPEFTDSEAEGEDSLIIDNNNKAMFTDSESEGEDLLLEPLTERSKKLPVSNVQQKLAQNNDESNVPNSKFSTMAQIANQLFSDDDDNDNDDEEEEEAVVENDIDVNNDNFDNNAYNIAHDENFSLRQTSSISMNANRPLTPMETLNSDDLMIANNNNFSNDNNITNCNIDTEEEKEAGFEDKENDPPHTLVNELSQSMLSIKTLSSSPTSSTTLSSRSCSEDNTQDIQRDWPYKKWVLNSIDLVQEMDNENKYYLEKQEGRRSQEKKFYPLSMGAKVMLAHEKGSGADLGLEGAALRFRRILKSSDEQLGPLHPLSISAAADLGSCLTELGGSGVHQEAEIVLKRVLRYREVQDQHERDKLKKNLKKNLSPNLSIENMTTSSSSMMLSSKEEDNERGDHEGVNHDIKDKDENEENEDRDDDDDDADDKSEIKTSVMTQEMVQSSEMNILVEDEVKKEDNEEEEETDAWSDRTIVAGLALAQLYKKMKRSEEAIALASRAVYSSEVLFGLEHKQTLLAMRTLASSYLCAAECTSGREKKEFLGGEAERIFHEVARLEENLHGLKADTTKASLSGEANAILLTAGDSETRVQEALRLGVKISHLASVPNSSSLSSHPKKKSITTNTTLSQGCAPSSWTIYCNWCMSLCFPDPTAATSRDAKALALAAPVFMAVVGLRVSLDPWMWDNFQCLTDGYDWIASNQRIFSSTIALGLCLGLMIKLGIEHLSNQKELHLEKELILKIICLPPLLGISAMVQLVSAQPKETTCTTAAIHLLKSTSVAAAMPGGHENSSWIQILAHMLEMGTQIYEAVVVHQFLELMFCFTDIAKDKPVPVKLRGRPVHLLFPLNLIWPHLHFDEELVKQLTTWTKQYIIVKVFEVLARAVFIDVFGWSWMFWICDAALFISTTFAMGALVGFYHTYAEELAPHNPLRKFIAIKLVVIICSYQKWMLGLIGSMGLPTDILSNFLTQLSPYFIQFGLISPLPENLNHNEVWKIEWDIKNLPCLNSNLTCTPKIALEQFGCWLTIMESGFIFAIVFYLAFDSKVIKRMDAVREGKKVLERVASIASFSSRALSHSMEDVKESNDNNVNDDDDHNNDKNKNNKIDDDDDDEYAFEKSMMQNNQPLHNETLTERMEGNSLFTSSIIQEKSSFIELESEVLETFEEELIEKE